jgi:hypothetical protein
MPNIKVSFDNSGTKVRVGQQNGITVRSSVSGAAGGNAENAINAINAENAINSVNVIGGIASVTQLSVSGLSTFLDVATFQNDVYIGSNLYISNDLVFDEFTARNGNITGILTVGQSLYYPIGEPYGIAYFDQNDKLVSTGTTAVAISETNYIVSTNSSGVPTWASVIDGGSY